MFGCFQRSPHSSSDFPTSDDNVCTFPERRELFTKKFAVLMFAVLFLAGCSNQKFKPEYRTQIHTVKILPVVWAPKEMTYMGREQAWGAALGAGLGAGVGMAAGASNLAKAALGGAGFAAGLKAGDLASMPTVDAILYNMETADINLILSFNAESEQDDGGHRKTVLAGLAHVGEEVSRGWMHSVT